MNRADLITIIAKDVGITKSQADKVLRALTKTVITTLKRGDRVTLIGFGIFSVLQRKTRNGRNPQTGAVIKINSRKIPKFKPGKNFDDPPGW